MANSRSQSVADPPNRSTRATSRQAGASSNQASGQLQGSNSRIEGLDDEEQPLERRDGAASGGSGQATGNPRTSQGDGAGGGDEPGNTGQPDDTASQDDDSDAGEVAPQGEPRTSSHTLRGNVAGTPSSGRSRRSAVSRSDYEKLQIQYLASKNEALELRLGAVERGLGGTGHRREHSDDHYRHDTKRASRLEKPKMQPVTNYNDLVDWIADCEAYIESEQPKDFRTEREKTKWAASLLEQTKRSQWRTHEKSVIETGNVLDWTDFCEYLKAMLSNPEMRTYECELKLEHAKQRDSQSVSDFVQYLDRLYGDLDYTVTDAEKLRTLRRKTLQPIVYDSFKHADVKTATTYASLTSLYIVIENTLRGTGQMKKTGPQGGGAAASHNTGSSGGQASNANHNQGGGKPQGGKKPSVPANRPQQPSQGQQQKGQPKPKGRSKEGKPKIDIATATCYTCSGIGHLANDPKCPLYAQRQEIRNRQKDSEKDKA